MCLPLPVGKSSPLPLPDPLHYACTLSKSAGQCPCLDILPCKLSGDGCRSVHKDLTSTLCEDTIVASMLLLYGAGRSMLLLTLLRSSRCMLLLLTLECHACVLQPAVVTLMPTPMWIMNSSLHSETNATCPAALLHCEPTLTLLPRIGQRCYDQVAFLLLPPLLPCLAANYDHEPYVFTEMTVQSPGTAPWLADGTGERVSCPSRLILA